MYKKYFKRLIDVIGSSILLLILIIPLIIISIWLHFANKGAGVFFLQDRPGKGEKVFKIIKFKTMNDLRDKNGKLLPDNQRLTKAGKFIRSTSIDELPQLLNILKGDMSFIGPRPLLIRYLPWYSQRERLRHTVRPGMSGWAQVNGRNCITWNEKLEDDAWYAENISLALDLKILFKTIKNVLNREGVLADKKENYLDLERAKKLKQ